MREVVSFDRGWRFHMGDIEVPLPSHKGIVYDEAKTERALRGPAGRGYDTTGEGWQAVDLPHDYIIHQLPERKYNEGLGFFPYPNAWYVKKFTLTEADRDKRLTLLFEGVATQATVYVNGCLLKHSYTGYTEFEVDFTDFAEFEGENTLSVYVDTRHHEGWWYEGGGIYRHVWLKKTHRVSVDLWGIYVSPQKGEGAWRVPAQVTVRNDGYEDSRVKVECRVLDARGGVVAIGTKGGIVNAQEKRELKVEMGVDAPALWSPDSPYQYTLEARVLLSGKEVDRDSVRFGFREVYADPERGLFINGKHYKIQGVCGHADCGLTGKAVPDNLHRHKVRLMREMGANGYRTTHYPQSRALMDALDENGFLVMDEVRWFDSSDGGLEQLEALVKRDRNRPGVIFWSLGNEEYFHVNEKGRRIAKKMLSAVRRLDPHRMVMTAICITPDRATVCDELDAIGVNYCWEAYDAVHKKYPDKAVVSSENCATGTTRGWYAPDCPEKAFMTAYDHDATENYKSREYTWRFISEREWLLGGYQWIAFEHRGEATWPRLCSQSGAIDLYMQKKDAFWQNRSHWTTAPMVHLLPHWNHPGKEGEEIRVFAYTNLREVELFLNGVSRGRRKIEKHGHGEWLVPYAEGEIKVLGYQDGRVVAEDRRVTSGAPYRLALVQDTPDLRANGEDIGLFTCYVTDKEGREVWDATPTVTFSLTGDGEIYSTGSDITDHTSLFLPTRRMRAGRITVAVRMGTHPEGLCLMAQSEGLEGVTLQLAVCRQAKCLHAGGGISAGGDPDPRDPQPDSVRGGDYPPAGGGHRPFAGGSVRYEHL